MNNEEFLDIISFEIYFKLTHFDRIAFMLGPYNQSDENWITMDFELDELPVIIYGKELTLTLII